MNKYRWKPLLFADLCIVKLYAGFRRGKKKIYKI